MKSTFPNRTPKKIRVKWQITFQVVLSLIGAGTSLIQLVRKIS